MRTGVGLNVLTALAQTLSAFAHVFIACHRAGSADALIVLAEAKRRFRSREMVAVVVAAEIEAHFRRVDIFSVHALGEFVFVTLGKILLRILGPVVVVAAVDARRGIKAPHDPLRPRSNLNSSRRRTGLVLGYRRRPRLGSCSGALVRGVYKAFRLFDAVRDGRQPPVFTLAVHPPRSGLGIFEGVDAVSVVPLPSAAALHVLKTEILVIND